MSRQGQKECAGARQEEELEKAYVTLESGEELDYLDVN